MSGNPIKPLDPYLSPSADELAAMSEADMRKIDAQNRAIHEHNAKRFLAAHKVAEAIDPTNRELRSVALKAPASIRDAWSAAQGPEADAAS